ncbi:hypothetical protein K438DRAFT_1727297, partial [Mycena galopus ATCC 62051]
MSPYARERVKRAHNGRETRGVLAESTSKAVGSSTYTILCFFLTCTLLFMTPLLVCFLAFGVASYGFSLSSQSVVALGHHVISGVHSAALFTSLYSYWTILCVYFVYLKRPHALNTVKYQTFNIPWRFRRDHVSHMRLDRLQRVCHPRASSGTPHKKVNNLFSIFVDIAGAETIVLTATPMTRVSDVRDAVCHLGYARCFKQGPIYLMGRWRSLHAQETMSDLGVHGLCHFILPFRVLGGAPGKFTVRGDGAVVDEHGFEQCALSADGTLKDSDDIEFGPDPGTPPPEASGSRPTHGKNPRYRAIIAAEGEIISDDDKPAKSKRKRKVHTTKGKEKATESDQESAFSADSESDLDSEAGAEISNKETSHAHTRRQDTMVVNPPND